MISSGCSPTELENPLVTGMVDIDGMDSVRQFGATWPYDVELGHFLMRYVGIAGLILCTGCFLDHSSDEPCARGTPCDCWAAAPVPAGTFVMGNYDEPIREHDVRGWESTPAFTATLMHDTWIGVYEATGACYSRCVDAGACPEIHDVAGPFDEPVDSTLFSDREHRDRPAVGIDWSEANALCTWLGGRLPTEAEWERAARGDDGREVPWGGVVDFDGGFCAWANFPTGRCTGELFGTSPVGSFPAGAGPYGHLDLIGNADELVADGEWYYDGSPKTDPIGPATSDRAMVRSVGDEVRGYARHSTPRAYRHPAYGTRCAWDFDPAALGDRP